jgi:peroxiredoxin
MAGELCQKIQAVVDIDTLSDQGQHTTMPIDLPVPVDDGACDHLLNHDVAEVALSPTSSPTDPVNLSTLPGLTIVFCYPRTGQPDEVVPDEWNAIPGARSCTPQACSFRDRFTELKNYNVSQVFGLSTQSTEYQQEVKERLHLPYDLLSDEKLEFVNAMKLPVFEWEGKKVVKRITLAIRDGKVVRWWYPVFPSDRNVDSVLDWLRSSL